MFAFAAGDPSSPRSRELPAGLADRVRPTTPVAGRTLPVPPPLAPLFPAGSLRRGTTTTVTGLPGRGATTLALALLAAASAAGSWCAAVGLPDPGVVAAAGLGLDLRRVVFVPHPGNGWAEAAGDLLSGVDAVLVRPPGRARLTAARHLTARARERQAALVVLLEVSTSSVYPSASACATISVARLVAAPGRLSTMNCWPRRCDSHSPISRALMSDAAPGGKPTMMCTGRAG